MKSRVYLCAIALGLLLTATVGHADGTSPGPEQWQSGELLDCWSVRANSGDPAPADTTSFGLFYINGPDIQLLSAMGEIFHGVQLPSFASPEAKNDLEEFDALDLWRYYGEGAAYPQTVFNLISDTPTETVAELRGMITGVTFNAKITVIKGEENDFHSPISVTAPIQWQGYCSVDPSF